MNKKRAILVGLMVFCAMIFLAFSLVGCSSDPIQAKKVIFKNTSDLSITSLAIRQDVVAKIDQFPNILSEPLASGESLTFYLSPYMGRVDMEVFIVNQDDVFYRLAYDYLVDGENEPLELTFTGFDSEGLTVTGSNGKVTIL